MKSILAYNSSSSHLCRSSVAPSNNALANSGSLSPNLMAGVNPEMVALCLTNLSSVSGQLDNRYA